MATERLRTSLFIYVGLEIFVTEKMTEKLENSLKGKLTYSVWQNIACIAIFRSWFNKYLWMCWSLCTLSNLSVQTNYSPFFNLSLLSVAWVLFSLSVYRLSIVPGWITNLKDINFTFVILLLAKNAILKFWAGNHNFPFKSVCDYCWRFYQILYNINGKFRIWFNFGTEDWSHKICICISKLRIYCYQMCTLSLNF